MRILCGVLALAIATSCDGGVPSCKDAVDKAVKNGAGASESQQQVMTKTCEDNKWPADVRACLVKATSRGDARDCLKPVMADLDGMKESLRDRTEATNDSAEDLAQQAKDAADEARAAAKQARAAAATIIAETKSDIANLGEVQKQLAAKAADLEAQAKALAEATTDDARTKGKIALATLGAEKAALEAKLAVAKAAVDVAASAKRMIGSDQ